MAEEIVNKADRGSIAQIILNALAGGDKYGYEICKDIAEKSEGRLVLKQPSLYSSLHRMESYGSIRSYWGEGDGGRRHYYSITDKGRQQYEKGKHIWLDYEALSKALNTPAIKKIKEIKTDITQIQGNLQSIEQQNKALNDSIDRPSRDFEMTTVVKQENLFSLTTAKKDIPHVVTENDNSDGRNQTYMQFDLFNQTADVVSTTNTNEQQAILYKNKYADLADYKDTIQPAKSSITKTYASIDISDIDNLKTNYSTFANQKEETVESDNIYGADLNENDNDIFNQDFSSMKIDFSSDFNDDNSTSQNDDLDLSAIEECLNSIVQKQDQTDYSFPENFKLQENIEISVNETPLQIPSKPLNEYSEVLPDDARVNINKNIYTTTPLSINLSETKNGKEKEKEEEVDYKNILGTLYSGFNKNDPYNKKFNEENYLNEVQNNTTINAFDKSLFSSRTYINQADDDQEEESFRKPIGLVNLDTLKTSYLEEGIRLRKFTKNVKHKRSDNYINYSKIKRDQGLISGTLMLIQIIIIGIIMSYSEMLPGNQEIIYYLATAFALIFPITSIIYYTTNPDRKIETHFKINISLFNRFLAMLVTIVFILSVNLFMGMTALNELDFLNFWLLPSILTINYILSGLLYYVMLKSKRYNA